MTNKINIKLTAFSIIIFIIMGFSCETYGTKYLTDNEKTVPVTSESAVVLNTENNILLYSKKGDKKMYPASCTKLLTAIIVLEECDLSETITVSENAVFGIHPQSSHIALDAGEKITVEDAVYAMLLTSANDAAVAVAEHVSGSVEEFSILMNKKAAEIGCTSSNFTNPHGLHEENHYSTANDLALIMSYCTKNEEFLKINGATKYTMKKTNKTPERELWNSHRLLGVQDLAYEPALGGKNGYVTKSKFNLVTYASKDNMKLVTVALGNNDSTKQCNDTISLFEYYFKNYKRETVSAIGFNKVQLTAKKKVPIRLSKNINILIPKDTSLDDLKYKPYVKEHLSLLIKKEEKVATVDVIYKGKLLGSENLVATQNVSSTLLNFLKIIGIIIICSLALFVLLIIILRAVNKRKKSRRKNRRRKYRR